MIVEQRCWTEKKGWELLQNNELGERALLVLIFGAREKLKEKKLFHELRSWYPAADLIFSSSTGEISNLHVVENSVVVTAVKFEKTAIKSVSINIREIKHSKIAGERIAKELIADDLNNIIVFSDGQLVNGDELTNGFNEAVGDMHILTGALAGGGVNFGETIVGLNSFPKSGEIVGIGFYGNNLKVGHGSISGWSTFGPERLITKSAGNVLYELDGKSALSLYKRYLGEKAGELPASALLFPLGIKDEEDKTMVIRTIVDINDEDQSMVFAGDLPEGSRVRLMRYNYDRLLDGASMAAECSMKMLNGGKPDFALLISCLGRKLVLEQRVEEELDEARDVFGDKTLITGFYSNGEICPSSIGRKSRLHNQTMTITTFLEE